MGLRVVVCLFFIFHLSSFAERQPNIVFLLADDLGYADLACFGSKIVKSPNIDSLASEGMKLTHCYSASPNCSPARTGLLTGRSPYRVGMYDFARFRELHIPTDETTVAEVLRDAGYQTMFAGKWHCSGDFPNQPNPGDHGFEHWFANKSNFGKDAPGFYRNGKALKPVKGWMSEVVVDEAMSFLDNRDKSKPFMTMLWFSEPHTPVLAADKFLDIYKNEETEKLAKELKFGGSQVIRGKAKENQKARYFGCISMMDHHIGRLLDYLKKNNLDENTIVVFTSDNGPEHRVDTSFGSPGDLRGAKGHIHEGGYRVPGIIKWPGKIQPNSLSQEPVNGTDWLPTLASAANAKLTGTKTIDGADVLPALISGKAIKREKPMMWWLYHSRGAKELAMRLGDYKILANMLPQDKISINDAKPAKGQSIMDFIKKGEIGNFSLYNLREDPNETKDLSTMLPEKLSELKKIMIKLHHEIRQEGPEYEQLTPGSRKRKH
ncbi:MAG: sulfatase-like hydrolase/transferase [Lentisphaeraceae bacterium]|nr:sulfatase-like hydrolase/transferase [Lentisphaeraceae bacterium]